MTRNIRYVGLDVHAATIAVAVTEGRGEVRSLGAISNTPEAVAKLVKKLGAPASLHACYEAGPTGYTLYWQLTKLGVHCEVIAPSLIPVKSGDRVKTDRRDAEKLARLFRAGDLTSVFVPSVEHEALRDLVRAREAAKTDQLRARHRLSKYLLRYGKRPPAGRRPWTLTYWRWVRVLKLDHAAQEQTLLDYIHEVEHQGERIARLDKAIDEALETAPASMSAVIEALQALRGVAKITAVTLAVEVGSFGKTTTCRRLVADLHTGLYRVLYVSMTTGNVMDMYKSIAWELGLSTERNRAALFKQIRGEVTRLCAENRLRPVLIVDEAHHLRTELLEDLCLLTNYAMDSENRLTVVLVGHPELRRRMGMAALDALSQRIVVRANVRGLQRDEMGPYLTHRLKPVLGTLSCEPADEELLS